MLWAFQFGAARAHTSYTRTEGGTEKINPPNRRVCAAICASDKIVHIFALRCSCGYVCVWVCFDTYHGHHRHESGERSVSRSCLLFYYATVVIIRSYTHAQTHERADTANGMQFEQTHARVHRRTCWNARESGKHKFSGARSHARALRESRADRVVRARSLVRRFRLGVCCRCVPPMRACVPFRLPGRAHFGPRAAAEHV